MVYSARHAMRQKPSLHRLLLNAMFAVRKPSDFQPFFMSKILRHTNDILTLVYRCTAVVENN